MQLQMETCNLDECDFLETGFIEYENEEEFLNDGSLTRTKNGKQKGVIMHFTKNNEPFYEYMPLYISKKKEYNKWLEKIIKKNSELMWITNLYWKLDQYSCVLVARNKLWFKHAIVEIEKVWNTIVKEKETGYQHRAPKRKVKKQTTIDLEKIFRMSYINC